MKLFQLSIIIFLAGKLAGKLFEHMKREIAATKVQNVYRGYSTRNKYIKMKVVAIAVQAAIRATFARCEFEHRKHTKAATTIQVNISNTICYTL